MIPSGREVRIDPAGKLDHWRANEVRIGEAEGTLYVPSSLDATVDTLGIFRDFNHRGSSAFESIGRGSEGIVYKVGAYALKRHWRKEDLLPTLRATRMLEAGLAAIEQPAEHKFKLRGIHLHGWFSPVDGPGQLLMEYIQPVKEHSFRPSQLPDSHQRERLYTQALEHFGVTAKAVEFDDVSMLGGRASNLMIERLPRRSRAGVAVKHDIMARPRFFNY